MWFRFQKEQIEASEVKSFFDLKFADPSLSDSPKEKQEQMKWTSVIQRQDVVCRIFSLSIPFDWCCHGHCWSTVWARRNNSHNEHQSSNDKILLTISLLFQCLLIGVGMNIVNRPFEQEETTSTLNIIHPMTRHYSPFLFSFNSFWLVL